jgi:hypothetical protein
VIAGIIGAVIGARLGRKAGLRPGAAVEEEIGRQVAEKYQRQAAWEEYYRQQRESR